MNTNLYTTRYMMKFCPNIVLTFFAAILVSCKEDKWEVIRPFFGEKPEESLQVYLVPYADNWKITAFLLESSVDWAHKEIARLRCGIAELTEQDERVISYLNKQDVPCTIWRTILSYDLPGTHYQAVQPTYILFRDGEVIFYLHDEYSAFDRIAPRVDPLPELSREK